MYILNETRPVWAEVNLDDLAHNIKQVRENTKKDSLVTAVVKANGYGHGSVEIARTFLENGADRLGVAIITEGIEIRKANINEPLLIFGYTPESQYGKLLEYNLIPTIYSYDQGKILSDKAVKLGETVTIHIKIDSGMGRLGFIPNEKSIKDVVKILKLPNLYVEGIYTHFATADELDKAYTNDQFTKYVDFVNDIEEKGFKIPIKHVSNSPTIMDLPEFNLNMVRAGIMIYGLYPSEEVGKSIELRPAMTLKTRVTNLKTVGKNVGISYGLKFVTDKETKIATLPIGYADGFTRLLTGKVEVFINGHRASVVGSICMDQCMVDVSHIEDVELGDEVIIFGSGKDGSPTVGELAKILGTINHEIVCMIGRRVPRVYTSKGEIVEIREYLLD